MPSHQSGAYRHPVGMLNRRHLIIGTTGLAAATFAGEPGAMAAMRQDATPMPQPDMTGAVYPFQIGSFACHSVSDGASTSPDAMFFLFAGSPAEEAEEALAAIGADPNMLVNHHTATLIDTGEQLVLVDTGIGPGFSPTDGFLLENLQGAGIAPEDIDVVILTHGHPDHIGGNTDGEGNPNFANARYVISQEEWEFWTDRARVEEMIPEGDFRDLLMAFVDQHLVPLEEHMELIGYDEEIVPGIRSIAAQGHTPGHMAVLVESDGERLWIGGDMMLHPANAVNPELVGFPDVEPERMIETRRGLLPRMAEDGALTTFFHFDPFPSLGHIIEDGDTWRWEPLIEGMATPET